MHGKLLPSYVFTDDDVHFNYTAQTQPLAAIAAANRNASRKCGWRGRISDGQNDATHPAGMFAPIREHLVRVAAQHPASLDIQSVRGLADRGRLSLAAQVARWRCLLDVRGAGFSSRTVMLLHSARPLLYVERPHLLTFVESAAFAAPLRPWVHYVPVAADLRNLAARADWVLEHRAEAERIAAHALAYARCFLTTDFARRYFTRQLLAAGSCAEECFVERSRCQACQMDVPGNRSRFHAAFARLRWVQNGTLPSECERWVVRLDATGHRNVTHRP